MLAPNSNPPQHAMPNLSQPRPSGGQSILFLLSHPETTANDNHHRLPQAFEQAGWQVAVASHRSLHLAKGVLQCGAGEVKKFDRLWLLGFGDAASFFDRMQLLLQVPPARFVVSPQALLCLHGKFQHLAHSPVTYVSNDLTYLLAQLSSNERWVVKPTAGSNADGVRFVRNVQQAEAALAPLLSNHRYAILQHYVPAIEDGEIRVLCVAGKPIVSYLRKPAANGLTNLSRGAEAKAIQPGRATLALAQEIAMDLLAEGVAYCAVDLAGDKLIETNIANPGGLGTVAELTAQNYAHEVVAALSAWWGQKNQDHREQ